MTKRPSKVIVNLTATIIQKYYCLVWYLNGYLIGSYLFDENVTGPNIREMLMSSFLTCLENVYVNTKERMWIPLDGDAPNYAVV